MAKFCQNCGNKLEDQEIFCGNCGTRWQSPFTEGMTAAVRDNETTAFGEQPKRPPVAPPPAPPARTGSAPAPRPVYPAYPQPQYANSGAPYGGYQPAKKKSFLGFASSHKPLTIGVAAGLVVVIVLIVVLTAGGGGPENTVIKYLNARKNSNVREYCSMVYQYNFDADRTLEAYISEEQRDENYSRNSSSYENSRKIRQSESYKVIDTLDLTEQELAELKRRLYSNDYRSTDKISAAKSIKVEVTRSYTGDPYYYTTSRTDIDDYTVICVGGKWYIYL